MTIHVTPYPDVSEVLRGETLLKEDDTWIRLIHEKQRLADSIAHLHPQTVLEIGCGTGIYATMLRRTFPTASYMGVDSNPEALDIARRRNPKPAMFIEFDFRRAPLAEVDFVCAHAFLKHFSLDDWNYLFPKFLSLAPVAQFDMQTNDTDTINDGSPSFGNNLWVSQRLFDETLAIYKHRIVRSEIAYEKDGRRATIYLTERITP